MPKSSFYQGDLNMDNKKKEKLVAIVVTTLISLAVSAVACLLGISPEKLPTVTAPDLASPAAYCVISA